jgi:hypothetical protein
MAPEGVPDTLTPALMSAVPFESHAAENGRNVPVVRPASPRSVPPLSVHVRLAETLQPLKYAIHQILDVEFVSVDVTAAVEAESVALVPAPKSRIGVVVSVPVYRNPLVSQPPEVWAGTVTVMKDGSPAWNMRHLISVRLWIRPSLVLSTPAKELVQPDGHVKEPTAAALATCTMATIR